MKSSTFFLGTICLAITSSAFPLSFELNARGDPQPTKPAAKESCKAGMLPSAPPGIKCYDNLYFSEVTPPPGYYGLPPDGSFENCQVPNHQVPPPDIRCYRVSDGVEAKPGGVYGGPIPTDKKVSDNHSKKKADLKYSPEDRARNEQQACSKDSQAELTKNDKNYKRAAKSDHHSDEHHHSGKQPKIRKGYQTVKTSDLLKNSGPLLIDDPPRLPVPYKGKFPIELSGISRDGKYVTDRVQSRSNGAEKEAKSRPDEKQESHSSSTLQNDYSCARTKEDKANDIQAAANKKGVTFHEEALEQAQPVADRAKSNGKGFYEEAVDEWNDAHGVVNGY